MRWRNYVSLALVMVAAVLAAGTSDSGTGSGSGTGESGSSSVDLNANIRFTGSQFIISNKDSFDWTNCKLEVNPKMLGSGFEHEGASLRAGETYSVGALQFANSDGQRFNPFTHKPQAFSIYCDTPRGKGFYYGGWN
jgi:hypothetical protein